MTKIYLSAKEIEATIGIRPDILYKKGIKDRHKAAGIWMFNLDEVKAAYAAKPQKRYGKRTREKGIHTHPTKHMPGYQTTLFKLPKVHPLAAAVKREDLIDAIPAVQDYLKEAQQRIMTDPIRAELRQMVKEMVGNVAKEAVYDYLLNGGLTLKIETGKLQLINQ